MGFRVLFKIDSITADQRHVGYQRTEDGQVDRSKPVVETSATLRLSAVEPARDPDRQHPNNQVFIGRISGNLVLTNVSMDVASQLENGHEYFIEVSQAPVPEPPAPLPKVEEKKAPEIAPQVP
ncbi:MAG TPA: hypothetical protein VI653_28460 [Steroidobacteraceae bacterium]